MDISTIIILICVVGWFLTTYFYSKRFRDVVNSGVNKIKGKAQDIADKDNRKNDLN